MRRIIVLPILFLQGVLFSYWALSQELPSPTVSLRYPKLRTDQVALFHQERLKEAPSDTRYDHAYNPSLSALPTLPIPHQMPAISKSLSLREAIALSLRTNPAVQIAELQRILDKFGLETSLQKYRIQWSPLTFTSTIANQALPTWSASTGIAVNAPTGTSVSIQHANNLLGGMGKNTLSMTQQLMKDFGLKNGRVIYQNAIDNEQSARLAFKASVITDVINVINAYNTLVADYKQLDISERSLRGQEDTFKQMQLKVKVGQSAPGDLTQQQVTLETTRLGLVTQEQTVKNDYQSFLTTLGLPSYSHIVIDKAIGINNESVPNLKKCIAIALVNNVAYQQALLSFNITKRGLITAENDRKWSLSIASNVTLGTERSEPGGPIESLNTNPNLVFSLSVPIDDISSKSAVVRAKVAIENAEINLEQTKETLIGNVVTQIAAIQNLKQQIKIAELQVTLSKKSLSNARLRLQYGQSTIFEENSLVTSLLSQQLSLVKTKISYLNTIETLYQTLGLTLDKWEIKLRY